MLVFRSFAIGLSAACFALLVMGPTVEIHECFTGPTQPEAQLARAAQGQLAHAAPVLPTIIDAAPGITAAQLAMTIRLQPGEQIVSLDDVSVTSDLSAGILLASRDLRARQYIDVGVAGPSGERRVLVLLH
jgi:hypothetical protein